MKGEISSVGVEDAEDHPGSASKLYERWPDSVNGWFKGRGREGVAGEALDEDDTLSDLRSIE
jgi:hypothetical protein